MLEDAAIRFIGLGDTAFRIAWFAFTILGAAAAFRFDKSTAELQRAPYFVRMVGITLLYTVLTAIWLWIVPAILGGYVWVLLMTDLLATILAGYTCCKVAMARSRDGYGHSRNAVLAFIPVANLILLFRKSRAEFSYERIPAGPLTSGAFGVIVGLVMIVFTTGLSRQWANEIERRVERMARDPTSETAMVEYAVKLHGLDAFLSQIAGQAQPPLKIDAVTTLQRVEADGSQLRRMFTISSPGFALTEDIRAVIDQEICATGLFLTLMRFGASIQEKYIEADGTEIGSHTVTLAVCAARAT